MRPVADESWLPELDLHQHVPLQRRLNCSYSIREELKPLVDSHRRMWVYKTSPRSNGIPCWNRTSLCGFANRRLDCSANGIEIKKLNQLAIF
jgi:hypothetical protein